MRELLDARAGPGPPVVHGGWPARWLLKCPAAVAGLPPHIAAASLVLAGANFEGIMPAWPQNLLTELTQLFGCERVDLARGMALLCNAYGDD